MAEALPVEEPLEPSEEGAAAETADAPDTAQQDTSVDAAQAEGEAVETAPSTGDDIRLYPSADSVKAAQFKQLTPDGVPGQKSSLDLILDVELQLSVELGRTKMTVREILDLGPGSALELDKLAGEPVELMVNGKLIARGDVVVIDENFGVRVTEIVSPAERIQNL